MAKHDPTLDTLFAALSDPTRRAMLNRLMQGPASVSDLAQPFDMALPTILQHLTKLEAGGLISTRKEGRTRVCTANPAALAQAADWLADQRAMWEARLDRLEAFLDGKDPKT
ncbi:MAG: metalloregulator ArsR/SmtB family transcription factor [Pseudomonadota bacterium]